MTTYYAIRADKHHSRTALRSDVTTLLVGFGATPVGLRAFPEGAPGGTSGGAPGGKEFPEGAPGGKEFRVSAKGETLLLLPVMASADGNYAVTHAAPSERVNMIDVRCTMSSASAMSSASDAIVAQILRPLCQALGWELVDNDGTVIVLPDDGG